MLKHLSSTGIVHTESDNSDNLWIVCCTSCYLRIPDLNDLAIYLQAHGVLPLSFTR